MSVHHAPPSNEADEIRGWFAKIERAKRVREEADIRYGYSRSIKEYQGDYQSAMPGWIADATIVPINEVYAYVKTFIPSVYAKNPAISVNAMGKAHIGSAKMLQLAVRAYWRELRLRKEIRRVILDAVLAEGWMKVGYTAVFGSIEPEEGSPDLNPSEYVQDEEIFATRVPWRNMVRDPDAVDGLHDARWVAERIIRPLAAVQASTILENTGLIKPTLFQAEDEKGRRFFAGGSKVSDEVPYAELWEVWDRDTDQTFTISDGTGVYHSKKKWPYDMEGFPYELLRFNENPDEAYAPNLIAPWEPQLWEKIKLRSMQLDHIKRFNRQLSIEEGSMTRSEMEKLTMGKTGSITKRKKGMLPPAAIVYPPLQSDIYAIEGRVDLDKDNISGQPNAVRSAPQKTQSRTLGEIDRLISSFQSRQTEPTNTIEEFSAEIAYKLIAVMKQYLPGTKFVRATQKDAQEVISAFGENRFDGTGFTFTKEDIQKAEFEIEIKTGSTLPSDKLGKIDAEIQLLKLGPTIGIIPGGEVALTIGKDIVSEFGHKAVEEAYDRAILKLKAQEEVARQAAKARLEESQTQISEARDLVEEFRGNGDVQ